MTAPASPPARTRPERPGAAPTLLAALVYLGAGTLVWWHLWGGGIGSSLASGSLDPAQDVWWLAWVPHALGQGLDPFLTRAMYHPHGVNVVANTSFLLWGLLLSPVTVLAGPSASFSVSVVLAPALDALAAFVVLRRFVRWAPAAFAGGLLFGFGPFVATDLRYGHLNLTVLVLLPLGLLLFDRALVRRHGSPWRLGVGIGLVVVGQFFLSVEVLALGVIVAAVAMAVVLAARGRRWHQGLGYTTRALGAGVAVAAALLAYPTWWYVAGPRHFTGAVWGDMSGYSASLASFVQPHGELAGVQFVSGGNGDYLGPVLLLVLAAGVALWRADRVLRFAAAMVVLCGLLALGPVLHVGPRGPRSASVAWPLLHLPLLSSVAASRFGAYAELFAALGLAVVLDHLRDTAQGRAGARTASAPARAGGRLRRADTAVPVLVAGAVALAALVPVGVVAGWPYRTHRIDEPPVVQALARLPDGTMVREYPFAEGTDGDGEAWQAEAGMRYLVVEGYAIVPGAGGHATIAGPADPVGIVFAAASLGRLGRPFGASLVASVRVHAFEDGVGAVAVVVPSRGGQLLGDLLHAALGPPAWAGPSGWLWRAPGATLSGAVGTGGAPCCAAPGGGG
ncbi:MAG: hypothetical protein KGJ77_01815 [Acidobacteriota bacterium]|nr:hypothetical protein [Acidobacteriota bacterium]